MSGNIYLGLFSFGLFSFVLLSFALLSFALLSLLLSTVFVACGFAGCFTAVGFDTGFAIVFTFAAGFAAGFCDGLTATVGFATGFIAVFAADAVGFAPAATTDGFVTGICSIVSLPWLLIFRLYDAVYPVHIHYAALSVGPLSTAKKARLSTWSALKRTVQFTSYLSHPMRFDTHFIKQETDYSNLVFAIRDVMSPSHYASAPQSTGSQSSNIPVDESRITSADTVRVPERSRLLYAYVQGKRSVPCAAPIADTLSFSSSGTLVTTVV